MFPIEGLEQPDTSIEYDEESLEEFDNTEDYEPFDDYDEM